MMVSIPSNDYELLEIITNDELHQIPAHRDPRHHMALHLS